MNNCFWPILVFLCISFMMKTRIRNFSNFKTFLPSLCVVLHLYCSGLVPPHFLPEWVLMGIPSSYLALVSSSCQLCFTYYIETDQVFPLLCSPQWLCFACWWSPPVSWEIQGSSESSRCFPQSASPLPSPSLSLFQPYSHLFCLYWWFPLYGDPALCLSAPLSSCLWVHHPVG